MNKLLQANKKIENAVVGGYKAIEDGAVSGYQAVENAFVGGYKKIEKKFVDAFLTPDSEPEQPGEKADNQQGSGKNE